MKADRYLQEARDHIISNNAVFYEAIRDMMDTLAHHDCAAVSLSAKVRKEIAANALNAMREILNCLWRDERPGVEEVGAIARLLEDETRLAVEDKAEELAQKAEKEWREWATTRANEEAMIDNKERAADIRAGGFFT